MIDYKKNTLDYGELLNPPEGYKLGYAVATTYSLDLLMLLSIPVALHYRQHIDSHVRESRMDIIEAIQKASDSMIVYCQKGKISMPRHFNKIISQIEDCIVEILPGDAFSSFHPKVWIIRYVSEMKKPVYRVIVLSRNLTFDRSWDLAFYCEGEVGKTMQVQNKPLDDFLRYLHKYGKFPNSSKFISDLQKVDFKASTPFKQLGFFPLGFPERQIPFPARSKDLLIVSPFVQSDILDNFRTSTDGNRFLFSRKEELDKLTEEELKGFTVYSFSQRIVDGEDQFDEGALEEPLRQNLHAKLFIFEKNGNCDWYLGSANCSKPAMKNNQEFLIHLKSNHYQARVNSIKRILLGEGSDTIYFEEYHTDRKQGEKTDDERNIRQFIYGLLKAIGSGALESSCVPNEIYPDQYDVHLHLKKGRLSFSEDFVISLALFGSSLQMLDMESGNRFERISFLNLNPFVHWSITDTKENITREFISKINIELPSGRKEAIFRSLIDSKEKFLQYLQFLLGNDFGHIDLETGPKSIGRKGEPSNGPWNMDPPILEDLLFSVSRDPAKLKDVDRLINQLDQGGDGLVPEDFKSLWSVFKHFVKNE